MARFVRLLVSLVLAGLVFSGCLSAGQPPTAVLKAFYAAANEGRSAEAQNLISTRTRKEIFDQMRGFSLLDGMTKDRTIDRVDFFNEQINGERATVNVTILYLNGEKKYEKQMLVKENGEWKVTFLPVG